MSDPVYPKKVQQRVDAIEAEQRKLQDRIRSLEREKVELIVGQSPIKVGAKIKWSRGGNVERTMIGRVTQVSERHWRNGFEYRVVILSKSGKALGMANVNEEHHPELL